MPPPSKKLKAVPGQQSLFAGYSMYPVYIHAHVLLSQEKTLPLVASISFW